MKAFLNRYFQLPSYLPFVLFGILKVPVTHEEIFTFTNPLFLFTITELKADVIRKVTLPDIDNRNDGLNLHLPDRVAVSLIAEVCSVPSLREVEAVFGWQMREGFLLTVVHAGSLDWELEREELRPILQQSVVDRVNNDKRATWKAGFNPKLENHSVKDFRRLCGTILTRVPDTDLSGPDLETGHSRFEARELPKSFDARQAWPHCPTIGQILDQGHCGSCWAFGAVETLSDRFCIHGYENVTLSENDLLACCGFECGYGCEGGYPYRAWQYFKRTGVVSSTCDPYFDTVGCGHPGCSPLFDTPVCQKACVNDDLWSQQKHFAVSAYYLSSDPEILKMELYKNGPIEVAFEVYEDFAHYKSGIYQHLFGDYMGGHAVKLIGWGTENGVDYWTVANSWNAGWGENGYFRIIRGVNECGIEAEAVAGLPLVKKVSSRAEQM
ncbi:hypothetical protein R1sor_001078 [Riccia sorocarpa]|uniref:Peptidase C1A papain C-terminal domain-containing protein n=1 Tax=Riccia sorocarpa TaxID=122646 RepID=A0ABD3GWX8_9MARC